MSLLEENLYIKKTYILILIKKLIIAKILKYKIILSRSSTHDIIYFLLVS